MTPEPAAAAAGPDPTPHPAAGPADVLDRTARVAVSTAKGFMPEAEGQALHRAGLEAARRSLGPFLEVGSYCGLSAVWLGTAARASGTVLFSVDHHRGSEENQAGWAHHDPELVDPVTGRMDTLPLFRRTIDAAALEGVVVGILGESTTVARHWRTELSLLFIDGGHGDEVVRADEAAWVPWVALDGLLAIHDVFPDPADGGRPPFELFARLTGGGAWAEVRDLGCGSLRVLRRVAAPSERTPGAD